MSTDSVGRLIAYIASNGHSAATSAKRHGKRNTSVYKLSKNAYLLPHGCHTHLNAGLWQSIICAPQQELSRLASRCTIAWLSSQLQVLHSQQTNTQLS
jgi:hypothetical protein